MNKSFILIAGLAGSSLLAAQTPASSRATAKKVLFAGVAVGGTASLAFWLPTTLAVIVSRGVGEAIDSTLLHRVVIDVATVAAGIVGYRMVSAQQAAQK